MKDIMKERIKRRLRGLAVELAVITAIAGALTLAAAALDKAEAREVVCMPTVEEPTDSTGAPEKVPTRYTF